MNPPAPGRFSVAARARLPRMILALMPLATATLTVLTACDHRRPQHDDSAAPTPVAAVSTPAYPPAHERADVRGGGGEAAPQPVPRVEKWVDLQPGDCLTEPPPTDPAVVLVDVVDCGVVHAAEVYARAPVSVNEATSGTADHDCTEAFTPYTGKPVGDSPFAVSYLIDSGRDRTDDNPKPSTVICVLQDIEGRLLAGSAQR